MKIVITDKLDISDNDRKKLEAYPNITIYDDTINEPNVIIDRIKDAQIITANYIDITADIINSVNTLKYIISPAVGYDWIDAKAAALKNIKVINCPTFNTYAVAEHAIGLIFAVYRKIVESHLSILNGQWQSTQLIGHELRGKKLLSIGYGNVGKSVISLANGLGMQTTYANSKTGQDKLNKMISSADVVVLCYPLNDYTKGSFDAQKIALLKPDAILINVARGLILDQDALYKALKENQFLGAGLDVFNHDETLTKAREDIIDFAKLPNVVTTSHIAYNTHQTKERFGTEFLKNLDAILQGNPINVVNWTWTGK